METVELNPTDLGTSDTSPPIADEKMQLSRSLSLCLLHPWLVSSCIGERRLTFLQAEGFKLHRETFCGQDWHGVAWSGMEQVPVTQLLCLRPLLARHVPTGQAWERLGTSLTQITSYVTATEPSTASPGILSQVGWQAQCPDFFLNGWGILFSQGVVQSLAVVLAQNLSLSRIPGNMNPSLQRQPSS